MRKSVRTAAVVLAMLLLCCAAAAQAAAPHVRGGGFDTRSGAAVSANAAIPQPAVSSASSRLPLIAGMAALGFGVLLGAFLLIRRLRKPAFGGLQVSVATLSKGQPAPREPTEYLSLAPYQTKAVPILTLLLYFRQPPLTGISAADADKLLLCPARKGVARLKLADKSLRITIRPAVPAGGSAYLLPETRAEMTAASNGDRIVLSFRQAGDSPAAVWD